MIVHVPFHARIQKRTLGALPYWTKTKDRVPEPAETDPPVVAIATIVAAFLVPWLTGVLAIFTWLTGRFA